MKHTFYEKPDFLYNDRTHKVFYNCKAYQVADDEDLKGLMEFIQTNKATTDFSRTLEENVKIAKRNTKWEDEYMFFTDVLEEEKEKVRKLAWKEGRTEGIHSNAIESARNFLKMKVLSNEQIAQGTGLSLEEVQKLASEI